MNPHSPVHADVFVNADGSLLRKSWHGHLAREKRLFSWQIPAMNHGQDARATLFASPPGMIAFILVQTSGQIELPAAAWRNTPRSYNPIERQ